MVDARDLKSLDLRVVRVQVPPWAPIKTRTYRNNPIGPFLYYSPRKSICPTPAPLFRRQGPFFAPYRRTNQALFHGQIHATNYPARAWISSPDQGGKDTFFHPPSYKKIILRVLYRLPVAPYAARRATQKEKPRLPPLGLRCWPLLAPFDYNADVQHVLPLPPQLDFPARTLRSTSRTMSPLSPDLTVGASGFCDSNRVLSRSFALCILSSNAESVGADNVPRLN